MPEYLSSNLLLDQLAAEGTHFVFGSMGSAQSPIMAQALETRSDIHYLCALHEDIAGSMAIGFAQASGKPGVLSLSGAPGLINSLASVYNANRMKVPLIVLCDQQDTQILNEDPPLSADLLDLAHPVCKWTSEARTAAEIPKLVRRAFNEALSPPRGSVFLSLPANILMKPSASRIIPPPQASPLGGADISFLKKASKKLVSAMRPCMILGNEVSQYMARKEAVTLAEVLGCPAFCEPMPTGVNFPNRHPQFAGVLPVDLHEASRILADFDVILIVGMQNRMPPKFQEPALIAPNTYVIQINVDAGLAGRTLPCHLSAIADVGESLSRLRAEVQLIVDANWVTNVRERAQQTIAAITHIRQQQEESVPYPAPTDAIPLIWLLKTLDAIRPAKSIIVNDIVCDRVDPSQILSLEGSSDYFASNSGTAGYGAGAAMGVQWASPETPVICLCTDETILSFPQSMWTASHFGLQVKFVVVNTLGTSRFRYSMLPANARYPRMPVDNPQVSMYDIATTMRIPSAPVTIMEHLEPALERMFRTAGPFLLEIRAGNNLI